MSMRLQSRLRHYFVTGFFTLIPIGLSAAVVWSLVVGVDRTFAPVLDAALGFHIPGLGIIAALAAILAAGFVGSHVLGERMLLVAEHTFERIPVFKWVYGTIKQMTEAFSPSNKASFKSAVLVEYPRPGSYSLGFVTGETILEREGHADKTLVSVYVPTNHVYIGDIILVPSEHVIATHIGVQQGIQIALSAGATFPERVGPRRSHPKK